MLQPLEGDNGYFRLIEVYGLSARSVVPGAGNKVEALWTIPESPPIVAQTHTKPDPFSTKKKKAP